MDLDACFGVTAPARPREDLEQVLLETDRVVIGHGALIAEAADVLDVEVGWQGTVGGGRVRGRLGETAIVAGEKATQDRVGLVDRSGTGATQFTAQAVLHRAPETLDTSLGLGRGGGNPPDAKRLQGAAHLGTRGPALELLVECGSAPRAIEDPVSVTVDGDGEAHPPGHLPQDPEIACRVFLEAEARRRDLIGRVVDGALEDKKRTAPFQPVVLTAVQLHEQARLGHARPLAAVFRWPPPPRSGDAGSTQDGPHGGAREGDGVLFGQQLGQMLVIEAAIDGAGKDDYPFSQRVRHAIGSRAAPVPMGQTGRAFQAKGGQEPLAVAE